MKLRTLSISLLFAVACLLAIAPLSAAAAVKDKRFLKNMAVSGTNAAGDTFKGKVTVTEFGYDETSGGKGLWVSGFVHGTVTKADGSVHEDVEQAFTQVHATLNENAAGALSARAIQPQQQQCQILFLDIGPIFLDLLGLQIDLSEIILDITAVGGAGNLLGNLLCAVAGLLDPGGFLTDLIGGLTGLLDFLNQINDLIGQL